MFDAGVMHPTAKTTYASVELRNQAVTVNACVPHLPIAPVREVQSVMTAHYLSAFAASMICSGRARTR